MTHGLHLFTEDSVAVNQAIVFRVEMFEPTEGFNPTKPYKTRLKWRDLAGNEQSKLLLTEPETVENVLTTGVQPKIEQLEIAAIDLPSKGKDRVAFTIRIGQATAMAPHQNVSDHKYYRRHNFKAEPMHDYEVRDAMRRSIAYGRKFGLAWSLVVEIRRLRAAAGERHKMSGSDYFPRMTLMIAVSGELRGAGEAVIFLEKSDRKALAELVREIDEYNSIIETVDPGQRENARLTEPLKRKLYEIELRARDIAGKLEKVIDEYP